ncbi:MAG: hypothetical protein ACRELY_26395 [Polyangiaceae bacterium]
MSTAQDTRGPTRYFLRKFSRFAILVAAGGCAMGACSDGYGNLRPTSLLVVHLQSGNVGSPSARLPLALGAAASFTVHIEAHRADGSIDTSFNGQVRISSKPGTVATTAERTVTLQSGVADQAPVDILAAFGNTRIWAEDLGYVPVDPNRPAPPQCSDGKDNNGNDKIDFPNDPGCYSPIDDSEDGGTYISGTSEPIYFVLPRIADVRGVASGGAATTFPNEQVSMDTGYDESSNSFSHSVVVTRISPTGFFATDIDDPRGFSSVMAYNFSAPPLLRVCDRLRSFAGTASDFYGFTEINYPAWDTDEWQPTVPNSRTCLVPDPTILNIGAIGNTQGLFRYESGLVRVCTAGHCCPQGCPTTDANNQPISAQQQKECQDQKALCEANEAAAITPTAGLHVTGHFGQDLPQPPSYAPTDTATNCDLNNDGKVDFSTPPESTCANACDADVECTEFSNFRQRSEFFLVLTDSSNNSSAKIQVDASQAAASFNPVAKRGTAITAFTGSLTYFSGGSAFTLEARCDRDIITDPQASPLPMDQACVQPITLAANNAGSN